MNAQISVLIEAAHSVYGSFPLGAPGFEAGSAAAALVTAQGNIYTGICIDLACGIGFCAEHSAIAEMLKNRETEIRMIVAVGGGKVIPPCGRCREMMVQINPANKETDVILGDDRTVKLKDLLPFYWNE